MVLRPMKVPIYYTPTEEDAEVEGARGGGGGDRGGEGGRAQRRKRKRVRVMDVCVASVGR
jgi:hypothetical protein